MKPASADEFSIFLAKQAQPEVGAIQVGCMASSQPLFRLLDCWRRIRPGHPGLNGFERLVDGRVDECAVSRAWTANEQPLCFERFGDIQKDRLLHTVNSSSRAVVSTSLS